MGVATTTTEVTLSAIQESLLKLSVSLGRIAARQDQMLVDLMKTTAALTPTATTSLLVMPGQASSLVMPGQASSQLPTNPSSPMVSLDAHVAAATTLRVFPALSSAMPTRCSAMGVDATVISNHAAVAIISRGNTEAAVSAILESSLAKPLQPCANLKFNKLTPTCSTLSSGQGTGSVEHAIIPLTAEVTSAAMTDPAEPLPIVPVQTLAILDPEKPTLIIRSTKCLDDDPGREMSMVSHGVSRTTNESYVFTYSNLTTFSLVVPVCHDAEDITEYGLFEEVLHHDDVEWKPWPPDLHVWVSHKKPMCRPRPLPSFACNQLDYVHMTWLPRPRPYLKLPNETLALLKYLYTEGRWWSLARHMEQWPFHDIVLGRITVCSSIRGILGHVIKQMISRMSTRLSLILFTNKPSFLLVHTLSTISFFHVERLLASRLSWHLDPGGSRHAGWVLNSKNIAGTIKIFFMNLLLDLNDWEGSKSRILASEFLLEYLGWQLTNAGKGTMPTLLCEWGPFQWSRVTQQFSRKCVTKAGDIKFIGSLSRDELKKLCGDNFPEWISFQQYEQVKWMNKHRSRLWPFVSQGATAVVKESVEPLLDDYRHPGIKSLKFKKFSLGNVSPKIEGIHIQNVQPGQIIMDIDFRWGGDPSIILAVDAQVASLPIQLKDLQKRCASTVDRVVALLAVPEPKIQYTLKAVGGNLTAIIGLSDMIDDTVNSIVNDMLQWPRRLVVLLGVNVDTSGLELKPGKTLCYCSKSNVSEEQGVDW